MIEECKLMLSEIVLPVSTTQSPSPGVKVSDSLKVIFPGMSMSNKWTWLQHSKNVNRISPIHYHYLSITSLESSVRVLFVMAQNVLRTNCQVIIYPAPFWYFCGSSPKRETWLGWRNKVVSHSHLAKFGLEFSIFVNNTTCVIQLATTALWNGSAHNSNILFTCNLW